MLENVHPQKIPILPQVIPYLRNKSEQVKFHNHYGNIEFNNYW